MTYDIEQCRNDFEFILKNFHPVNQFSVKDGKFTVYTGYLPIRMPAFSLRDEAVTHGFTFRGKQVVGTETYAHARDYAEGESIGIAVKELG